MAEKARPSAWRRHYTRAWFKASSARLDKYPLCADPFKVHLEIPEPATVTDHIVAHKGDRRLFAYLAIAGRLLSRRAHLGMRARAAVSLRWRLADGR